VIQKYQTNLDISLKPKEEPGHYDTITNGNEYRTEFESFLNSNPISVDLKMQFLLSFDSQVAALKNQFRVAYQIGLINTFHLLTRLGAGEEVANIFLTKL
jgi:hypothetical protein